MRIIDRVASGIYLAAFVVSLHKAGFHDASAWFFAAVLSARSRMERGGLS